jgi:hypothetical protein
VRERKEGRKESGAPSLQASAPPASLGVATALRLYTSDSAIHLLHWQTFAVIIVLIRK